MEAPIYTPPLTDAELAALAQNIAYAWQHNPHITVPGTDCRTFAERANAYARLPLYAGRKLTDGHYVLAQYLRGTLSSLKQAVKEANPISYKYVQHTWGWVKG